MDTLNRFSNRVAAYIRYRPDYPDTLLPFLKEEGLLSDDTVIADIGSGTGISSELFLKNGNRVYGVEPNKEMREAAERLLAVYPGFTSVPATAENTTLEKDSIGLVVAGQAFHWFDRQKCRTEFQRILRKHGYVLLMWNDRRTDSSPFLRAYEDFIMRFATDYLQVNHKNLDEKIFNDFFGEGGWRTKSFPNFQHFGLEGLKGRILSSSYMPAEGTAGFGPMMQELEAIFRRFEENGQVTITYDTRIFYEALNY